MADDEKVQTGYSRWSASTENVQLTIDDNRPACIKRMTWKRWIITIIAAAVLALVLGFIFGYITKRALHLKDTESTTAATPSQSSTYQRYRAETYEKLSSLIDAQSMVEYINEYRDAGNSYYPGSAETNVSLHQLDAFCKSHELTLSSVSFSQVLLSRPGSTSYSVTGANNYEGGVSDTDRDTLKPFVAYTHPGQVVTGAPVYVSYGYMSNYSSDVDYTGTICYMRYGHLNPFNMITNAAKQGCAGVVLYPDPEEFPDIDQKDAIIANGKSIYGDAQTPGFPSITENTYRLTKDEVTGSYIPPKIPVISASQRMVKPALNSLITQNSTQIVKTGPLLPGYLTRGPATDTNVTMHVINEFPQEQVTRSACACRGSIDTDKYVLVATHHDETGSGNVDPATGQAVMREMIRLIADNPDIYQGRRSIVFLSADSSTLNIAHHEFVEEGLREHGERMVAYIALSGTLAQGSYLHVKSSPPVQTFVRNITEGFAGVDARHRGIEGTHSYTTYYSSLAVPVIEMSFSDKPTTSGVDSLPVCCDASVANTDVERVALAAKIHLQTIMKLAGAPILPYNPLELQDLYKDGLLMVQEHSDLVEQKLIDDLEIAVGALNFLLKRLNRLLVKKQDVNTDNLVLRRLNDAITGVTRSCILPQGVPMIDPQDNTKVIRNLNNRNLLFGSVSSNDYKMVPFPGLYELFTSSADPKSSEITKEISKHITEILASMVDAEDYSRRATSF